MSNRNYETLSAMLDNEADELELRRLLQDAAGNPDLAADWERMCLVQALIHDDNLKSTASLPLAGNRLSNRIAAAIAADSSIAPAAPGQRRWAAPLAKMAIAASVALAFFLGMQVTVNKPGGQSGAVPVAEQVPVLPVTEPEISPDLTNALADNSEPDAGARQVDPEARQRLEEYIRSAAIAPEEPEQLEQLEESPLYRLVNEIESSQ